MKEECAERKAENRAILRQIEIDKTHWEALSCVFSPRDTDTTEYVTAPLRDSIEMGGKPCHVPSLEDLILEVESLTRGDIYSDSVSPTAAAMNPDPSKSASVESEESGTGPLSTAFLLELAKSSEGNEGLYEHLEVKRIAQTTVPMCIAPSPCIRRKRANIADIRKRVQNVMKINFTSANKTQANAAQSN